MAGKKKNINNGALLYGKILKEFTKVNKGLPENKQLNIKERRKYVSEELYPQFKGTNPKRVGVKRIKESVFKIYEKVIPTDATDVNLISPSTYDDVRWFEVDEYINEVLPKGIFIRFDAGELGSTKIFNTKTYNYRKSGVFKITEAIRKQVKNDSDPFFVGVKSLRNGKANNGNPKNYFIDFVLVVSGNAVNSIEPVIFKVPKEQKKLVTSVKNAINERIKDLNLKKKRKSSARKKATKNLGEVKKLAKRQKKAKSENYQKELALKLIKEYNKAIKQLENAFNRGNLSKEQYDKFVAELQDKITNAKRDGGII